MRPLISVLCFGMAWIVPRAAEADRPNFLVIVADDLGFSDLGCYGGEIQTPNLDSLAADGLRFTQFYNTARCWPTRTCLLTGYYPQQVRMDPPRGKLPAWTRVLPAYLEPLGYRTYHSGKWHLNGAPRAVADGGFDRSYLLNDHNRFFAPRQATLHDAPLPAVKPDEGKYVTTIIADYALAFLREHIQSHSRQPFLMYLAFTAPHFPLQAIQADIDRYRDRYLAGWERIRDQRYQRLRELRLVQCVLSKPEELLIPDWNLAADKLKAEVGPGEVAHAVAWEKLTPEQQRFQATKMAIHAAMVDRMDQEIGRVLALLRENKQFDNTVIFFLSDNGASAEQIIRGDMHDPSAAPGSARSFLCLGPGWSTAANTPFRRHKSWVHEGGISTPLIVHWPAGIRAKGQLRGAVGHAIDVVPTLLELAGKPNGNEAGVPPLPGKSLVPAFAEDRAIERSELYFHHIGNRALRSGDWKVVSARADGDAWELYNLTSDRAEQDNLAEQHPDRLNSMIARWSALTAEFERTAGAPTK